jgi:hypothetical protein
MDSHRSHYSRHNTPHTPQPTIPLNPDQSFYALNYRNLYTPPLASDDPTWWNAPEPSASPSASDAGANAPTRHGASSSFNPTTPQRTTHTFDNHTPESVKASHHAAMAPKFKLIRVPYEYELPMNIKAKIPRLITKA